MHDNGGFRPRFPGASHSGGPVEDRAAQAVLMSLEPVLGEILASLKEIRERLAGLHKPWFTIEEVADLTGRAAYTVRRWVKEKRIEAIKVKGTGPHGRLLVPREQLQRLIGAGMGAEVPEVLGDE